MKDSFLKQIALLALFATSATAGTHTWTGTSSGLWSTSVNWTGGAPASGEASPVILIFPAGASHLINTNNIGGLTVDQLNVLSTNWVLHGSGAGTNITFSGSSGLSYAIGGTNAILAGDLKIALSGTVPLVVSNSCTIQGPLQGSGGFTLSGGGSLMLNNAVDNSFAAAASVLDGTLYLKSGFSLFGTWTPSIAVPGQLSVGNGNVNISPSAILLSDAQLSATSTLNVIRSGHFYLNGYSNNVGSVTMNGGSIAANSPTNLAVGTLGLGGSFLVSTSTVANASTVTANLSLLGGARTLSIADGATLYLSGVIGDGAGTAGGITKVGNGSLALSGANTYTGPTLVNAGSLWVYGNQALGSTASGTTVASAAQLVLSGGISVGNEPLTLNGAGTITSEGALTGIGTNTWNGPITLASDSTITSSNNLDHLILAGLITGNGSLIKGGYGSLVFLGNNPNSYAGTTYVKLGELFLDCGYFIGTLPNLTFVPVKAVPGYLNIEGVVRLMANAQLSGSTTMRLGPDGGLDLNSFSTTCGAITSEGGAISVGNGTLTLNGDITATASPGHPSTTIFGSVSLGGASRQLDVEAGAEFSFNGPVSDGGASAGIIKTGPGSLTFNQPDSYSGPTVINNGGVFLGDPLSLGTGAGGVTVNAGGILYLRGFYGEPLNVSNVSLTLNGGTLCSATAPGNWWGPIVLASDSMFSNNAAGIDGDYMCIVGPVSGPGGVTIAGGNAMYFYGSNDNTYSGTTIVTSSNSLTLAKDSGATAISGPVIIGNATDPQNSAWLLISNPNQILNTSPLTVNRSGELDVQASDTIGSLTLSNGFAKGAGVLGISGNLTNYGYSQIAGAISLSGASKIFYVTNTLDIFGTIADGGSGFSVRGHGFIDLYGSNSFSGPLTVDDASSVWLYDNHALGSTTGPTIVTNGGKLGLDEVNVTGEPLVLSGEVDFYHTNSWTGPIQLFDLPMLSNGTDTNDLFDISGPVSGPGTWFLYSHGTIRLSGTASNTFTGSLVGYSGGLVELAKTNAPAFGGGLDIYFSTVRLRNAAQIPDTSPVHFDVDSFFGGGGMLDLNGFSETIGDLSDTYGYGAVNLRNGTLSVGGSNATNMFNGTLLGAGGSLDKVGTNTIVLGGTNTYTGSTLVHGGSLFVNGSQPFSSVFVYGATVGGTGTVGNLYINSGGAVQPGYIDPGKFNCGSLSFGSGATLSVRLNGPNAGVDYDQLNVTGTVSLNSSDTLAINKNFNSGISNQFDIINNDLNDSITGSFNYFGNHIVAGGAQFQIDYAGGSGSNDLVLTQLTSTGASQLVGIDKTNSSAVLSGNGIPSVVYSVQASTNLSSTNWTTIGSATAGILGALQFTDTQAANYPVRFYRFSYP